MDHAIVNVNVNPTAVGSGDSPSFPPVAIASVPLPWLAIYRVPGESNYPCTMSLTVEHYLSLSVLTRLKVPPWLNQTLTPVTQHQDTAWSGQHAQVNHPVSTSSAVYADEMEDRLSYNEAHTVMQIKGQPVQLPHHAVPVSVTGANIAFHSDRPDVPLVNAIMARDRWDTQDHASDQTEYTSIALSSPCASILLPYTAGYPLGYPQDDEIVSKIGEPLLGHHAIAGPTVCPSPTAIFDGYTAPPSGWADDHERADSNDSPSTSWSSSPDSIVPPLQGLHLSDCSDNDNIPMPPKLTANPARFTNQPYLSPYQETEVVTLHASTSIPPSSKPPLPSPRMVYPHDSSSNIGGGNLTILAGLLVGDHFHTKIANDPLHVNRPRGRARTHHRTMTEESASERISTSRAGCFANVESWTVMSPSAVRPLQDRNTQTRCGWQNEDGEPCCELVTYDNCAEHFAAVHGIKNMAGNAEVLCRWCALSAGKKITRKNILRHLREAHLRCSRSQKQDS
ncbi:hypothetical protein EDC04DRAFT_2607691 [Pisolithus marmoratus]|nr:hypothetical protein EDC04DRAFT_2607691 [Pisolithus marmoratus]